MNPIDPTSSGTGGIPARSALLRDGQTINEPVDAPYSTIATTFKALVDAFNGIDLSAGGTLYSTYENLNIDAVSMAQLPAILFSTGRVSAVEYQAYVQLMTFNPTAIIKTEGPPGEAEQIMRSLIDDLYAITALYRGLYVTKDYQVRQYSMQTLKDIDDGKLYPLADWDGPYLQSVQVLPPGKDSSFSLATAQFNMQFLYDTTPDNIGPVKVFSMGTQLRTPNAPRSPSAPFKGQLVQPVPPDDVISFSRMAGPARSPVDDGAELVSPFHDGEEPPSLDLYPEEAVASLNVSPASIAAGHTAPPIALDVIATSIDYSTSFVTPRTVSSNSGVATAVGGIVTPVAAGSCLITVSYGGQSVVVPVTIS